jgi:hypothetical protein
MGGPPFVGDVCEPCYRKEHPESEKDPQRRFWVEAEVATAKSAVFLAFAEEEADRGDLIPAAWSAFYSVFHLSLALMWLLPQHIEAIGLDVAAIQDAGEELPSPKITCERIKKFLMRSPFDVLPHKLSKLFEDAKELREFANYGPRVTYDNQGPVIGPCSLLPRDVRYLVGKVREAFNDTLKWALPQTADDGELGATVVDKAADMLDQAQFPFKSWCSTGVREKAKALLTALRPGGTPMRREPS